MFWLVACASVEIPLDPVVTLDPDSSTTVTVTWDTPVAGDGVLHYGEDDAYGTDVLAADSADGLAHQVVLTGLPPGEEFHLRVESATIEGQLSSADVSFVTPLPPQDLPSLWPDQTDEDRVASGYILTSLVLKPSAAVIFDPHGNMVWWHAAEADEQATQARLSADGSAILVMTAAADMVSDKAMIHALPLDGGEGWALRLPGGHHDFIELPDGRFAYPALDVREYNGRQVAGDQIVEIDRDGTTRVVWSVWDTVDPATIDEDQFFYGDKVDWTHVNSLTYDPATRRYWVSSHNLSTIFVIDADTGAVHLQIGGTASDVTFLGGEPIASQHAPFLVPGGFLVFNNGEGGTDHLWSEAVEYAVDETAGTATRVWSYRDPDSLYSPFLGCAERLSNGDTLISWGAGGRVSEVTAAGDEVFHIDAGLGAAFGYTHAVADLGGG